jgi:hypothetical protein
MSRITAMLLPGNAERPGSGLILRVVFRPGFAVIGVGGGGGTIRPIYWPPLRSQVGGISPHVRSDDERGGHGRRRTDKSGAAPSR